MLPKLTDPKLTDKAWSPYLAGVVIGLLQIPAFLLIDTALGASSSYVKVTGHLASLVDGGIGAHPYFAKYMAASKYWWQLALVLGIGLGALASARLSGARRQTVSPIWAKALGSPSRTRRYVIAFAGGFVLLFGARLAGGCTSGHGISGLAQLSLGSAIAVAAMFAGGIATALVAFRRIQAGASGRNAPCPS